MSASYDLASLDMTSLTYSLPSLTLWPEFVLSLSVSSDELGILIETPENCICSRKTLYKHQQKQASMGIRQI